MPYDERTEREKIIEGMCHIAVVLANYRKELIESGVSEKLADMLVLDMQGRIMNPNKEH